MFCHDKIKIKEHGNLSFFFASRPSSHIIYAVHLNRLEHKACHYIFQYLDDLPSLTTNFTIHICVVKHKLVLIVMF